MSSCPSGRNFNPRARVGRDTGFSAGGTTFRYFNPRARVGRDKKSSPSTAGTGNFNPRARVGRDNAERIEDLIDYIFQSTRPRGARPLATPVLVESSQFQSTRPRGARRFELLPKVVVDVISIHAPAWGATWGHGAVYRLAENFNPRARVGRDCGRDERGRQRDDFNPRARVGRDV